MSVGGSEDTFLFPSRLRSPPPRHRRTRLLFVGAASEMWVRIALALEVAGHQALRVADADAALAALAVDPGATTLIVVQYEKAEDLLHLAAWVTEVSPLTRLVALDGNGMLRGYGDYDEVKGAAGTMLAAVRKTLRN